MKISINRFKKLVIFVWILSLILTVACTKATPTKVPIFKYEDIVSNIDIQGAVSNLNHLVDTSPRIAGLDGEEKAGHFIYDLFQDLGLKSHKEEFPITAYKNNHAALSVNSNGVIKAFDTNALIFSASTPSQGLNNITAVYARQGLESDLYNLNLSNSIAMIDRGGPGTFKEKVDNCAKKGAIGVIFINNEDTPLQATLREPSSIPAISVSLSQGQEIMEIISKHNGTINMLVDSTIIDSVSRNIIGIKPSKDSKAKTLIIGAHYDSVDCPGANDNGSGTAALLEIARLLENQDLPFNIKFIAFGAEEIGLVGSNYHVNLNYQSSKDRKDIIGLINMDMVAMGEYLMISRQHPTSSSYLYDLAVKSARELGVNMSTNWSGRSDHVPFEDAGIPVVFLMYGPLMPEYYHTPKDNMDIIDQALLRNTIEVVIKLISQL